MSSDNKNNQDFEGLGKLLDHNYDDIRELDNPLPGWWLVTFWGTIVFAAIYYIYYEMMGGPTLDQELKEAMTKIEQNMQAQTPQSQTDLLALVGNAEVIAKGQASYVAKCSACHAATGAGGIGPNLADDFWIHGDGKPESIREVVRKGVLEKGMPAWEAVLPPEEVDALTVFVISLRGTNPPDAKAPQGQKVEVQN